MVYITIEGFNPVYLLTNVTSHCNALVDQIQLGSRMNSRLLFCVWFYTFFQCLKLHIFCSHFIPVFAIWISLCSEFLFSINGNVFRKLSSSPDKRGGLIYSIIWLPIHFLLIGQIKTPTKCWPDDFCAVTDFLESQNRNCINI